MVASLVGTGAEEESGAGMGRNRVREEEDMAALIDSGIRGWPVGPPPVVVFRVTEYLIAYRSNV
jgi:hypothetical protein